MGLVVQGGGEDKWGGREKGGGGWQREGEMLRIGKMTRWILRHAKANKVKHAVHQITFYITVCRGGAAACHTRRRIKSF